ncbi:Coiled-coil and C2 domain-containing protein 1-like [Holothuria leucospilota]|uniref:Coiled-coil and C2 domain-containing protein 1-like n=1 Tax=Holothuria leucospilota TaxID=206669 RepID=A0A9Q1H3L0_HOLLE|nr:Coiled-coil and C2 domain-containing protein 1-like [Holothuria leucospilota]
MFGRKKKKNVLNENAQLAQQLGISLPGMDIVLPQSVANDESDEMLEAELLALMEEEAHDERPTKSKRKSAQTQKEAETSEDDNEDDDDLLAELAEIESQEIEAPPATQTGSQRGDDSSVAPHAMAPQPTERMSLAPSSQRDLNSISPPVAKHHNPPSQQQTTSTGPQPAARLDNTPFQQPVYSTGPQPTTRLDRAPFQQPASSTGPQLAHRLDSTPSHEQAPPHLTNIAALPPEDNREQIMASVPKQTIAPVDLAQLIEERIKNYETALMNARANQEGAKERRYNRGLQTLKDLQKKAKAGRKIPEADIPPEVAVGSVRPPDGGAPQMPTTVPAPVPPPPAIDENTYKLLCQRRDLYKMAAFKAKKENDSTTAMEHLKIVKQFDAVITAVEAGEQVDLSNMPPPPSEMKARMAPEPGLQQPSGAERVEASSSAVPEMSQPRSVLEGLIQRQERYKKMAEKASAENNASKSRRLGRIVKQYDDAIKKEKAGKPVNYEELPELPDFPPLPLNKAGSSTTPAVNPSPALAARTQEPPAQTQQIAPKPAVTEVVHKVEPKPAGPPRKSVKEAMNERHLKILQQKKKKAMMMALQAKKQGDMEEAKRLLIIAKGFDPMIEAAENGLPVNMDTIPKLPDEEAVNAVSPPPEETPPEALALTGNRDEVYARLIATLQKQIEQCKSLAQAYSELGNVQTAKRFQEYCQCSQEDKDLLTVSHQHNDPVPRFHYEQRTIPSVRVSPGLKKEEAEITIIKGLDYKNPAGGNGEDLDTFVKFEFPYPSDSPQTGQTGYAKGVEDVEYQSTHKVQVNLKARSFMSAAKRKQIKFEVMYHKGLLRGNKVLGTASLKLTDLETKHEIHSSIPLCEGRKEIGGKLEVKVRIHHPLGGMKEEFVKEKWLVVDSKIGRQLSKGSGKSSPTKTPASRPNSFNPSSGIFIEQ